MESKCRIYVKRRKNDSLAPRHQSVTPFLSGLLPPKKDPGSAPASLSFFLLLKGKPASEQAPLMIAGYQTRLVSFEASTNQTFIYSHVTSRDRPLPP